MSHRAESPRPPMSAAELAELLSVSRETLALLQRYLDLLGEWQAAINLVGPASLADPWRRHILDCGQLVWHLPADRAGPLVDLGSGAGLPGLILAILGQPDVHLIESDRRKAQFLRHAARTLALPVTVHPQRIEQLGDLKASVITARALAPVGRLLAWSEPLRTPDTLVLLLKGQSVQEELTEANKTWTMSVQRCTSLSDPSGVLLKLQGIHRAPHR